MDILGFIALLLAANGAPLMIAYLFGPRYNKSVDRGLILSDGYPLFGSSKTWRGILASVVVTTVAAMVLGFPALLGCAVALLAMLGDLLSSYIKRRLGLASSSFVLGLDQIPETLLPALLIGIPVLGMRTLDVIFVVSAFLFLELASSRPLRHLGIRKTSKAGAKSFPAGS